MFSQVLCKITYLQIIGTGKLRHKRCNLNRLGRERDLGNSFHVKLDRLDSVCWDGLALCKYTAPQGRLGYPTETNTSGNSGDLKPKNSSSFTHASLLPVQWLSWPLVSSRVSWTQDVCCVATIST